MRVNMSKRMQTNADANIQRNKQIKVSRNQMFQEHSDIHTKPSQSNSFKWIHLIKAFCYYLLELRNTEMAERKINKNSESTLQATATFKVLGNFKAISVSVTKHR